MGRMKLTALGLRTGGLAASLAAIAIPQAASAQAATDATTVTERERQRAEDTSIRLGAFLVSPQATVSATLSVVRTFGATRGVD